MFRVGDIANDIYGTALALNKQITHQYACSAVAKFCGRSSRTVRLYADIAKFYDEQTRRQYDELSFSHFVMARHYASQWQDVLDTALSGEYSPLSVDETQMRYLNSIGVTEAIDTFNKLEIEPREISPVVTPEQTYQQLMTPAGNELTSISDELVRITSMLNNYIEMLSDTKRDAARKALKDLLDIIIG